MKHFLTALLLFVASFASAQIVNIPDPAFRTFLLNYNQVIDTNGDGQIQESEAQNVTELFIDDVNGYYINDLTGIKSFSNLQSLWTYTLRFLAQVDVSDMPALRTISLESSHIRSLNVSNCGSLETLAIDNVGQIDDSVTNLNINGTHHLRELWCDQFYLPELDLTQCDSLITLNLGLGTIDGILNVSGLQNLATMYFEGRVRVINATNAHNLKKLWATNVDGVGVLVDEMNFDNCENLEQIINVIYNGTSLDFSSCIRLLYLGISGPNIRTVNIKNGFSLINSQQLGIAITNPNPLPLYVCVDEGEDSLVIASLIESNGAGFPFTVNSYCTPTPGGIYNTIKGALRWDADGNGCNQTDIGKANIPVRIFDGTNYVVNYTSPTGEYIFHRPTGNFVISPYFPVPFFSLAPSSATVIFDTANNLIDSANFCIASSGTHNDIGITILPLSRARPGFGTYYQVVYKNRGTTTLSGNVQFNFDNSKMNLTSTSQAPNGQSSGLLSWNYGNLLPFESRIIQVGFDLLPPPVNNINDTLFFLAAITPTAGDATIIDNNFVLPQRTTGSYDPNDKECLQGEQLEISNINSNLDYIIRFQNLGNDTAFNVVVTDTLTSNTDWESFEMVASSHPCNVKRVKDKLEFYFYNIELPNASVNEAASHGFISFKIRPKNVLNPGDSLNNRASIYFDFNPAVVTNTASTIITVTSGPVPVKLQYFSISAKNTGNALVWKVTNSDNTTIFDIERGNDGIHFSSIGHIEATADRCLLSFNYTDDKPLNGTNYYRIKITEATGVSFYSRILATGNTLPGFEIKGITTNQNNSTLYISASNPQAIKLKIYAADGRLLLSANERVFAGTTSLQLLTGQLASGMYTLVITTDDGKPVTRKFLK